PRPPNRADRKTRRFHPSTTAARFRAHTGRRPGQARSASHRKSPEPGLHPASRYTASKLPPKAQTPLKPLIFMNDPPAPRNGSVAHVKGFWAGGNRVSPLNRTISATGTWVTAGLAGAIQYSQDIRVQPRSLWNTGCPGQAGA